MDYPDFYWSFYSGEKEVPGVFWVGIAFFFLLVILGIGISGLDLVRVNNTHQRPSGLLCIFPAFFFLSSTKSRFHRDSAFDWRYWFTESTIFLGVRGQKDLNFQQKKKSKNGKAFRHFPIAFLDGLISTTPPTSCHHQPLL